MTIILFIYIKLHEYKIPHNKVVSLSDLILIKWYKDFVKDISIKNKINMFHFHWVWDNKSEEFYGLDGPRLD